MLFHEVSHLRAVPGVDATTTALATARQALGYAVVFQALAEVAGVLS